MRSLHGITVGNLEAWVWVNLTGGNGAALGKVNGRIVHHLQLRQRGTPPPMRQENGDRYYRDDRLYWTPWQTNRWNDPRTTKEIMNVLCGQIKSASRMPRSQDAYNRTYDFDKVDPRACPDCSRVAKEQGIRPYYTTEIVAQDPWNAPEFRYIRGETADPVTGV